VAEQPAALAHEGDAVRTPRSAGRAYSMCRNTPSTLLVMPRQFGPQTASPAARAVVATASWVA
jgi:hypothetical protein